MYYYDICRILCPILYFFCLIFSLTSATGAYKIISFLLITTTDLINIQDRSNYGHLRKPTFANFLTNHEMNIWLTFPFFFKGGLQIENSREEDQGKYECVAENSVGTEHSKATNLYVKVRRVPPTFSRPPEQINEVMLGASLNLSCIAVGSPMPHVKWMKGWPPYKSFVRITILIFIFLFTLGAQDLTPENEIPIGRNVLQLSNIQQSSNYTCIAASSLGQIEAVAVVKVQCRLKNSFNMTN